MERFLDRHDMRGWVELAGRCDRETIHQVHAASDVYLAPATLESFGIAALEARCAAVPVVAMRVGGVGEFVRPGREGMLVGSDSEMADVTARPADLAGAPAGHARAQPADRAGDDVGPGPGDDPGGVRAGRAGWREPAPSTCARSCRPPRSPCAGSSGLDPAAQRPGPGADERGRPGPRGCAARPGRRCLAAMRERTESRSVRHGRRRAGSDGLARMRARRLASLAVDPGTPPFFARIDRRRPRDVPHRPPARARRRGRAGRHRLAGADRPVVLPGDGRRPDGAAAASAVRLPRRRAHVVRGRAPGPGREPGTGQRPAARGDRAAARRADAGHRRDHPARPGRPGAGRVRPLAVHPGCAGHRARPRSGCTGRRTCSTPTPPGCAARECWWSGPTRRSCTTSPRCCRPSARWASPRPPSTSW